MIKSEIKNRIEQRVSNDPQRFPRKIDAILLEDIEYFLCRDDLYGLHFKNILEPFYSGKEEVRKVLNRIIPTRNKLSHNNTISIHEAEQCICYTNDMIDVYKQHFIRLGKEKDFNVPTFQRIKDSLGNDIIRQDSHEMWEIHLSGISAPKIQLRSGENYKIWVEVDSSYDNDFYEIEWRINRDYIKTIKEGTGNTIEFQVDNTTVSYSPEIRFYLTTKRDWHRFHNVDDVIIMYLDKVLPPVEDLF